MAKKLISFRMDEDRIAELHELANVYTFGNSTYLLESLIRRMYFLEPLALYGKYRTEGFGCSLDWKRKFKDAWDIWVNHIPCINKQEFSQVNPKFRIEINSEITALRLSQIRDLAKILNVPIDTNFVYTISIKKCSS